MFDVREINIAVELWGVAFCVIGILCVLLFGRFHERYRRILLLGFASELLASGGDALAGFFRGKAGALPWAMTHIGNHIGFLAGFALVAVLATYLVRRVQEASGREYRRWLACVYATTLAMCVLSLLGTFFTIDQDNVYLRRDAYWLSMLYVVAVCAVGVFLVLRNRRKLGFPATACLLFYALAPLVAAGIQATAYGVNLVVIAGVLSLVVVFFEMQSHSAGLMVRQAEELAQSRVEVSESRIAVMVSQIQPHFLFNALDTIYGLVDDDRDAAKRAIASFSRYLRANLDSLGRTSPVLIETELEHVRTYLELERMADEGKIAYEIDAHAGGFTVPALSVQTLAENAVKHGISKRLEGGKVNVRTDERQDDYIVEVVDDGVGFDESAVEGVGVSNTRARLAAMCGASLEVHSSPGRGTRAVMRFPKKPVEGGRS